MRHEVREYPRVIVLAQNKIQPFTGGGVVLSALFHGFPPENIVFLHRDQRYTLDTGYEEYRLAWAWLRLDVRALFSHVGRWLKASLSGRATSSARDLLALFAASAYFKIPRSVDRRIRDFKPDIVYAWVADSLWVRTLHKTVGRYELPYVIHFMDNHFEVAPTTALQLSLAPPFREQLTQVAGRAEALYTISESMGDAYQRYWRRPYEVYRATINISSWPWSDAPAQSRDGVFRLAFTGSADQSQLSALVAVAKVLEVMLQRGRSLRLVLYLTEHYARMAQPLFAVFRCVEIRRHPDTDNLRTELLSVDALLLAYAFDETTVQYYRYSFATKIVPYMLSARPILVYGPRAIEPVGYCSRGRWALVVDDPDEQALTQAVDKLMTDAALGRSLARAAWEAAQSEHDREAHAARFASSLLRLGKRDLHGS